MYTSKHYSKKYAIGNYHSLPLRQNRIKATAMKLGKAGSKLKRDVTQDCKRINVSI
jgi:hypothetical protein